MIPATPRGCSTQGHAKNESVVEIHAATKAELLREALRLCSAHDLGTDIRRIGDDQVERLWRSRTEEAPVGFRAESLQYKGTRESPLTRSEPLLLGTAA